MHLSDPDANKFTAKIAKIRALQTAMGSHVARPTTTPVDTPKAGHRQVQHRLTANETEALIAKYRAGASIRDLAVEFRCGPTTVRKKIKAAGLTLPLTPPTKVQIDEMVRLYESGLSLARTGQRVGFTSKTVQKYLRGRGVRVRDTGGN